MKAEWATVIGSALGSVLVSLWFGLPILVAGIAGIVAGLAAFTLTLSKRPK